MRDQLGLQLHVALDVIRISEKAVNRRIAVRRVVFEDLAVFEGFGVGQSECFGPRQ